MHIGRDLHGGSGWGQVTPPQRLWVRQPAQEGQGWGKTPCRERPTDHGINKDFGYMVDVVRAHWGQ